MWKMNTTIAPVIVPALGSIAAIDQSSCRILTTHAMIRSILHDDWSIRLGENRPDRALKLH